NPPANHVLSPLSSRILPPLCGGFPASHPSGRTPLVPISSSTGNPSLFCARPARTMPFTFLWARLFRKKNGTEDAQCRSCHASAAALQPSFQLIQPGQYLLHFPLDIGHFPEAFVDPALGQP